MSTTVLIGGNKATDGEIRQIFSMMTGSVEKVISEYVNEFGLDKEGIQRINTNSKEVDAVIHEALFTMCNKFSVSDNFRDEEVESTYGYLSGYRPKKISAQVDTLHKLFPHLGHACEEIAQGKLPKKAEGWFAIPKWQNFAPSYWEAVQIVTNKIKETRSERFFNHCEDSINASHFRQISKTEEAFQIVAEEQEGYDILVIPAQFGKLHRGRSVRRVREIIHSDEFVFGAFAVGIMLLTHPERFTYYDDLWIDCSGDEAPPVNASTFSLASCFSLGGDNNIKFSFGGLSSAHAGYGSVSGFLR